MESFETKIEEYRKTKGLSQERLAELTGCRRETIVRLEKGLYNPSLKLAHDIAKVFKVPIEKIFIFTESH